ncbi:MAG: YggS family pyridoxal phosphate-dependent enzyme [Clostridia bacterium]|nr:YggS family pyridoxal phosphate-dependent enzyme [Clostridia bacterium]
MINLIKDNVKMVLDNIAEAAVLSGRKPEDITLVAVTKTVTAKEAQEVMDAGVLTLGENRVQSLLDKYEVLENTPTWHLIGHLQTNKVKYIADKVSMIHSVESLKLAEEIDRKFRDAGRIAEILVQVNVSGEESKFGITPCDAFRLIEEISMLQNVKVKGLMTMAPLIATPDECRKYFHDLKKLSIDIKDKKYQNVDMCHLSMGMSGDYKEAILEGATIVRVGSALFN